MKLPVAKKRECMQYNGYQLCKTIYLQHEYEICAQQLAYDWPVNGCSFLPNHDNVQCVCIVRFDTYLDNFNKT